MKEYTIKIFKEGQQFKFYDTHYIFKKFTTSKKDIGVLQRSNDELDCPTGNISEILNNLNTNPDNWQVIHRIKDPKLNTKKKCINII